jgi:hypothetical protein
MKGSTGLTMSSAGANPSNMVENMVRWRIWLLDSNCITIYMLFYDYSLLVVTNCSIDVCLTNNDKFLDFRRFTFD